MIATVDECAIFFARRRNANHIEIHPAQELFFGGKPAGHDAKIFEFRIDQIVDVIVECNPGPEKTLIVRQNDDLGARCEFREAREDERVAFLSSGDDSHVVNVRSLLAVREIETEVVYDACRSVRVLRNDLERTLAFFSRKNDFVGNKGDSGDLGDILRIVRRAILDPA